MIACGGVSARNGQLKYRVVAPILSVKGGKVFACYGVAFVYPLNSCSGVEISGVSAESVHGAQHQGASIVTPPVELDGTWNGSVLHVERQPQAAAAGTTQPVSVGSLPVRTVSNAQLLSIAQQIVADQAKLRGRGINVLETAMPTADEVAAVKVIVAVADAATVRTLEDLYTYVHVYSWLNPVSG